MSNNEDASQDDKFHYEIWTGPTEAYEATQPSITYVENHNADWDYSLAASDFKMAADAVIAKQKEDPHLDNWTAPVCHLIRQTTELQLKALLHFIASKQGADQTAFLFSHNLEKMWSEGKDWLLANKYRLGEDVRLRDVERLVANLHSIDPLGDLFRFGTSKRKAFGRLKSYDRVGINQSLLFAEFENAYQCVGHWTSVILREIIMEEMGWAKDPSFDADEFPRA